MKDVTRKRRLKKVIESNKYLLQERYLKNNVVEVPHFQSLYASKRVCGICGNKAKGYICNKRKLKKKGHLYSGRVSADLCWPCLKGLEDILEVTFEKSYCP